jgi:hypothetical protein
MGCAWSGTGRRDRGRRRAAIAELGREVREVKLTCEDIQSGETEGIVVDVAIHPHICALHETHVYGEEHAARPSILNLGRADEAVEVGDCRRLGATFPYLASARPGASNPEPSATAEPTAAV